MLSRALYVMKALAAFQIEKILKSLNSTKKVFKAICARNVSTRPAKNIKGCQAFVHNTGFLLRSIHWVLIFTQTATLSFLTLSGEALKSFFSKPL